MADLDLRLVRYFVAVARERNITRAAETLHISQPSLSAAMKGLERRLGVELLSRRGRNIEITPAGELLMRRGVQLIADADSVAEEVRTGGAASGRLHLGLTPTARYGVGPMLLAECTTRAPAVMIYTTEGMTGALLRGVSNGRYDLAVTFCAGPVGADLEMELLYAEPAVVHLPDDHPLAERDSLRLEDLAEETILVAGGRDSEGFTARILAAFAAVGIAPRHPGRSVSRSRHPRRSRAPRTGRLRPQRVPAATRGIGLRPARAGSAASLPPRGPPGRTKRSARTHLERRRRLDRTLNADRGGVSRVSSGSGRSCCGFRSGPSSTSVWSRA